MAGEPARSFRVATYNLNWGNRRGDQVLDAIATAKADVVFLQETTRQSERFLQEHLKKSYPYFRTVESQILDRQGSDHSLVVSELRLVEPDDERE